MKFIFSVLISLLFIFMILTLLIGYSSDPEPCEYSAALAQNYIYDISTDTESLAENALFSFPYNGFELEELAQALTIYTGHIAVIELDISTRSISMVITSDSIFTMVTFAGDINGQSLYDIEFSVSC